MKVKLCGFTDKKSVAAAIAQKCDFLGFVFCKKSPRFIAPENAAIISAQVPSSIAKVAVVVDPDFEFLEKISQKFAPDFFQFHGKETLEFLQKSREKFPKIKIIKAFQITEAKDLQQVKNFENCADLFLFDGKNAGSGEKFDWKILQNFSCEKDWFLSGGLNVENIDEALKITGAKLIDISSGIEKIRGEKSVELIAELMQKINFYAPKS
jgi:phosphoribosylanthranilate isomerase